MGGKPRVDRTPEGSGRSSRKASRGETSRRHAGVTASLRICSIAGRMNRSKEQRQRLGGSAAGAETEKDHRIRWRERWDGNRWRSKS
jgi:hypothetical protein